LSKRGKLIILTAPSASGKTTIKKRIMEIYPDLVFSVSATTRQPRDGEVNGKDYFFLSREEFENKIAAGFFLEWENVYGNYYGTPSDYIQNVLEQGKSIILDIDVKGAVNVKNNFKEAAAFFIMPPSIEELKRRLVKRNTETEEDIRKRLERAEMEFEYKDRFDYIIVNDDLNTAVNNIEKQLKILFMEENK